MEQDMSDVVHEFESKTYGSQRRYRVAERSSGFSSLFFNGKPLENAGYTQIYDLADELARLAERNKKLEAVAEMAPLCLCNNVYNHSPKCKEYMARQDALRGT
jgi:hypothetical protein